MKQIEVNSSKKYSIFIEKGLSDKAGEMIREVSKAKKVMLVSDDTVYGLFGQKITESLENSGFEVFSFVFENGEKRKNLTTYAALMESMCEKKFTRSDLIVALGGGVVGDLAGFAAATFLRGISFVQIPTTLLACVDSSVGGKTGVDLESGKNQVGAFKQPELVIIDTDFLNTLPKNQIAAGEAEVIKYAMIGNREFFESIENIPIEEQYENVIAVCVEMKKDFVEKDEFDNGVRMMLNFGHTVGHAIEAESEYTILHGEGVAMGMEVVTKACVQNGICDEKVYERLGDLLGQYGLKKPIPYGIERLFGHIESDKKNAGGKTRLIVPKEIGQCEIMSIETKNLCDFLGGAF